MEEFELQGMESDAAGWLGVDVDATEIPELMKMVADVGTLITRLEAAKSKARARIAEWLETNGMDSVRAGGRYVYYSEIKSYNVAEGDSPEAMQRNRKELLDFMERWCPDDNKPGTAAIGRAVNNWMDNHPGEPLPSFIIEHTRKQLNNRKG